MSNHLYIADTSVWIRVLRSAGSKDLRSRIHYLGGQSALAFNQMIRLELLSGCRSDEEFEAVADELRGFRELFISTTTWDSASEMGFRMRRRGFAVSTPHLIIAASAIEHQVVLVHADSDFDRIGADSALRVESYA